MKSPNKFQTPLTFILPMWVIFMVSSNLVLAQAPIELTDVVLQNEKKIALKFHSLINDYRAEKRKPPLIWNDTLYQAAANHNQWMAFHDDLDHVERTSGNYYTGREVTDRINYAAKMNGELYCGENCLFFTYEMDNTHAIADSMADEIALEAFLMWRSSPGHHANMVHPYKLNGTAFCYTNGLIWATDVFCGMNNGKSNSSARRKGPLAPRKGR